LSHATLRDLKLPSRQGHPAGTGRSKSRSLCSCTLSLCLYHKNLAPESSAVARTVEGATVLSQATLGFGRGACSSISQHRSLPSDTQMWHRLLHGHLPSPSQSPETGTGQGGCSRPASFHGHHCASVLGSASSSVGYVMRKPSQRHPRNPEHGKMIPDTPNRSRENRAATPDSLVRDRYRVGGATREAVRGASVPTAEPEPTLHSSFPPSRNGVIPLPTPWVPPLGDGSTRKNPQNHTLGCSS
jgi:hypothetical protein